jgi:glyoxylase-like metal-dependent hydrolase (beta-lactamase superfamily II)
MLFIFQFCPRTQKRNDMKQKKRWVLPLVLLLRTGLASAQTQPFPRIPPIPFDKINIITTKLSPRFYALTGSPNTDPGHPEAAGGRMGILIGQHGVFMVDCSYAPLFPKIIEAIGKIAQGPVRFLVNTHEHPDHTGGNPLFVRQGALLISRQETRDALAAPLPPAVAAAIGQAALTDHPDRLPVLTYDGKSTVRFYFEGETIDLIPVNTAHTEYRAAQLPYPRA